MPMEPKTTTSLCRMLVRPPPVLGSNAVAKDTEGPVLTSVSIQSYLFFLQPIRFFCF